MTAFLPAPAILAGLIGALVLPVCLVILAGPPFRVPQKRRFRTAVAVAVLVWGIGTLVAPGPWSLPDMVCGGLILATAVIAVFSFWVLMAYGFTISMLMALARADRPLTSEDWIGAYGGAGLGHFTDDRLWVLFRFGMIVDAHGVLRPTVRGRVTAALVRVGLFLFKIEGEAAA